MTELEYGEAQERLAAAARLAGHTLGTIHVEEMPTDPQAFEALLAAVTDLNVRAVIIPSQAHLGCWENSGSKYERLRRVTSAEIIVAPAGP
jgi:hypothetical protein